MVEQQQQNLTYMSKVGYCCKLPKIFEKKNALAHTQRELEVRAVWERDGKRLGEELLSA